VYLFSFFGKNAILSLRVKAGGLTMPIEFDITLTPKDMYRFNMYQVYSGFHGWFSIIVSILVFVLAGVTWGTVEASYTALYILFGIIFLFYMPVSLSLRSKHSLAASEVLRNALHYKVGDEGIQVTQGEASALLQWEQIYKMVATKSNVLVYSNRTNAYVIPREQLGEKYAALAELAQAKLPKYRVKMK
jgi:hypothetical protein